MANVNKEKVAQKIKDIERTYRRVLILDCYEGYEYKKLKEALEYLLEEVNKL